MSGVGQGCVALALCSQDIADYPSAEAQRLLLTSFKSGRGVRDPRALNHIHKEQESGQRNLSLAKK